jgi:anti-sigma factor RsiW
MSDNITPDDWESQLIDYTLGVLEPGEAAAFEAGLEECRRDVRLAREYGVVSGWMGLATPPAEPPDGHKNRLMSLIQSTPQAAAPTPLVTPSARPTLTVVPSPTVEAAAGAPPTAQGTEGSVTDLGAYRARRNTTAVLQALLGVAAVLIFLLGLWAWTANSDKLTAQSNLTAAQAQMTAIASRPNIPPGYAVLPLPPQKGYESVKASVIYNPQSSDVQFSANGLAQLPPGKTYELWFLKPQGNPDPAGTFTPDQTGAAAHSATASQAIANYNGFAVSLEPTPGSPAPTGPIIVAGTYSAP